MDYGERAKENFQSGYSCAQAVMGAFADDLPLERSALLRMTSSTPRQGRASPRPLAAAWAVCGRSAARSAGC